MERLLCFVERTDDVDLAALEDLFDPLLRDVQRELGRLSDWSSSSGANGGIAAGSLLSTGGVVGTSAGLLVIAAFCIWVLRRRRAGELVLTERAERGRVIDRT
jgi:hypothetical protein